MAFDPDEYLNETGTTSSTATAEFDPDAYLKETEEQEAPFDPDAYLSEVKPPSIGGLTVPPAPKVPKFEPSKPSEGVLRQAADLPVQFAIGINNSVKGLSDLFGADNPVSQNLSQNVDWYRGLLSAASKQDEEEVGRILQEAENKGLLDQLGAGLEAFSVAPADFVASGLGSLAVFAAGGLAGRAAGLGAKGIQAVQAGLGAGMGAGIAKGEIYQSVKDEMLAQGKTEEEAKGIAMEAQSFGGKNLDQILIAAGLGAVDAFTGAEKIIGKVLAKGGLKPDANRVGNILKTGISEAVPEFAQAAQEKFASNLALNREGVNVPLTQGVFSQGALEGLVGLGLGVGGGAIEPRIQTEPTKEEVAAAASETQDVARQSMDVAPATASLVEGEAEQIIKSQAETPDERVARLQREAQEAAGEIELEEEGAGLPTVEPTPPVTPTPEAAVAPVEPAVPAEEVAQPPTPEAAPAPEIAQAAQTRITEREGQAVTLPEEPTGNRVEAAAYQAPDGTVYYGPSHLDAMAKARDAGKIDQAAIDAKQEATSRETPEFGFATNADPFVSRDQAETIARQSGQITVEQPATGKLHSNEVSLDAFAQPVAPTPEAAPTAEAAPAGIAIPQSTALKISGREDTRAEYARLEAEGMTREEAIAELQRRREADKKAIRDSVAQAEIGDIIRVTEDDGTVVDYEIGADITRTGRRLNVKRADGTGSTFGVEVDAGVPAHGLIAGGTIIKRSDWNAEQKAKAAPEAAPVTPEAAVAPATPEVAPPAIPQLEPLRRVARAEQTEEDVAGLVDAGFVEVYNGQPVLTQAGLEALPEAERPRLTPEARKIQIDTRTSEAVAEAISKNLRIGVDQVPVDVRMPAGWTLVGDVYVPPTKMEKIEDFEIDTTDMSDQQADVFRDIIQKRQQAENAVINKPVGQGFNNLDEFRAAFDLRGQGHSRFSIRLDLMVEDGALTEDAKNLILATIWDNNTSDELLGQIEMGTARRGQTMLGYGGRKRQQVLGLGGKPAIGYKPFFNLLRQRRTTDPSDKRTADILSTFWHEYGHMGYYSLLNDAQKKEIAKIYNKTSRQERRDFFAKGTAAARDVKFYSQYYAKSETEWFAQSFAEYVIKEKSDHKSLVPIFEQILDKIKAVFGKLFGRKDTVKLNDIYDFILRGESLGKAPTWDGITMSKSPPIYGTTKAQAIDPAFTRRLQERERAAGIQFLSPQEQLALQKSKIKSGIRLQWMPSVNEYGNSQLNTEYAFSDPSLPVDRIEFRIEQFRPAPSLGQKNERFYVRYDAFKNGRKTQIIFRPIQVTGGSFATKDEAQNAALDSIADVIANNSTPTGGATPQARPTRPAPTPEVREARREPAITPQQDRDYLDAVERGDLETAQKMVEDAAKAAGYNQKWFHGTASEPFNVFSDMGRGGFIYFAQEPNDAMGWAENAVLNTTEENAVPRVVDVFIRAKNIFDRTNKNHFNKVADLMINSEERLLPKRQDGTFQLSGESPEEIRKNLLEGNWEWYEDIAGRFIRQAGFDGAYIFESQDFDPYNLEMADLGILNPNLIKLADPVTRDDQGNIIPLSQRFQPEQADIRYRRRVQMGRAGMEPSAVEARLQELGFPTGGIIRVVNEPDADFEGRTIILDGKVTGIELNAAAMRDNATIDRVLNHEFAESANADGALNRLVERLTPKEKKEINDTITRLRYEERARTSEEAARAIETLAEAWKGRGFFTRAVARVEAWASKLGFKLTRRAAEYIAARNLADINAGFRTAYNQFISVRGEVREGRAEDQAVVDADMGRRSQTELTPQEIDQLEKGEKIRVYRAMQIIDGKLYPPMSALVGGKLRKPTEIGAWEKAEERPDLLDKKGKFVLQKGNKTTVPAAYNPYFHTSSSPLNDQFSSAYKRDNLVTVEVEIPASELTSGYKAEGAKDAVGEVRWNAGPVSSKLPADKKRRVFLSRYAKVVRIVPDSEVAEVISGLLEGTNLSVPENTVTPSLRSELEKRGVAVTPRPARGQEIRESRREPEAIPTFTEGTPEAATLKEMEASMAKVDAASEAKGGKPETYKISEIASVWMDSGLGERELQDAIVEYTNLTPANAAKVAKAIARQYDIQQSIATAFLETQTGLSVEALPEGVTLPKEVDPDRPKPVMQRLFDVFMGVRVPPVKIQVNEKTALKQQIRLKAAANRAAKAEQKRTAEEVVEVIKAMELLGPVRPKQVQALAKRAARVIWTSEKSVEAFSEYAAKVVENANYDADLRDAKDAQKRAKQLSKQKKVAMSPQRQILEDVGKVPVNKLDDPRMFAEAVNYYLRGFKDVLSPDYVVIPDAEMESYLSGAQSETQRNQRDLDREANQRLAEKYGIDPEQVNEMMDSIDIIKQIEAQENREALNNLLTEKAVETQQGLRGYDTDNLSADQRPIVSSMLKIDPKALDPEERQRFIRITNNIIYNNQTNGAEYFVAVSKGQQSAREAAQDSTMIAKNRAWINLLPRFVSERMQRGWALELQSVADTFRNAFGKGAMAKVYDAIGMLDLNLGFTKANNVIDEIQEKIAEFHRNLEKKYKAAARNQDGLLAEGVVGFLIQSVPKKDEVSSINQRRDLIKQDIANRKAATMEPDRVAMANRIEAILNRIDGESVEAILNNMKREFPANHESLIWYKDTLLPQYKDFLKSFDENFNDQANNYENPNYLTIGFTSAGPSLAITPEEQSLFYDQVSLRPKQSAYTIKRVDYTELPKDATTGKPKEIEFNLRRNVFNGLSDQINKAYTSSGWQRIASFMKTPEAEVVFGGSANKDFFIERLNRLRLSRMRRGSMGRGGAIEKAVDSLSIISRKLGTGIALGGIYQWIKQPPDQLITALGSGGRADLLAKNIAPSTQKAARELLNKFSIGRRGDASAGYKYINQMEGHQNRLERYFSESKWDQAKEQAGKIADVWMVALKSSDFLAASAAWMTYYEGELNKQDIKIDDWSKEAELIESDPKRRQAAAFAEQMTDIYQGSSDPTSMATFAQSGKSGWENLVKAIFVPFNSFAIQQRMRLYSDARDAINGTSGGKGGLAGTVGGLILFHATKRYVIPAISGAGIAVLYGLMGVDMDEPDEEKQKEQANKNWRQFLADITGNLLVGGTPQIIESQFIDAMNRASYLVSLQLENDSILNDDGEIMSYDQYSKERSPFYRYKSFDNAMSLGMLEIGLGQAEQVALQTKMLATPEEMEMYTPEEQRMLYFSALSEWLYLMRLNDADFARLVSKARRDMIKAAKDREKELQRIRSGR